MNVKETLSSITDSEIRHRIFATPDIPQKKLANARSEFISRNEEVIVFVDNTAFGSGKGGLAITECHFYAKGLVGGPKSIRIDAINTLSYVSHKINLDIYINDQIFVTISQVRKADHEYLIMLLQLAREAATYEAAATANVISGTDFAQGQSAMQSCGACNAVLPSEAQFCSQCGQAAAVSCGGCGNALPADAAFCPSCGTKIETNQLPYTKANIPNDIPSNEEQTQFGPQASTETATNTQVSIDEKAIWANKLYEELKDKLSGTRVFAEPFDHKDQKGILLELTIDGLNYTNKYKSVIGLCKVTAASGSKTAISELYVDFTGPINTIEIASLELEQYEESISSVDFQIEISIWAAENIEVHQFSLKEGEIQPPTLVGIEPRGPVRRVVMEKLYAERDDDGFQVWCNNRAYHGHMIYCEVVSKPPSNFQGLSWDHGDDAENAGFGYLQGAKVGDTAYIVFGEAEGICEGLEYGFTFDCSDPAPRLKRLEQSDEIIGAGTIREDDMNEKNNEINGSLIGQEVVNWEEIALRSVMLFSKTVAESDDTGWAVQVFDSEIAEALQDEGSEWVWPWEVELSTDDVSQMIEAICKISSKIDEYHFIRLRAALQRRFYGDATDSHGEKAVDGWLSKLMKQ